MRSGGFLSGKKILVTGVLSQRSIAYGIAKALQREGATLAFTYAGENIKDRVVKIIAEFETDLLFSCDVTDDAQIAATFSELAKHWDGLNGIFRRKSNSVYEAIKPIPVLSQLSEGGRNLGIISHIT